MTLYTDLDMQAAREAARKCLADFDTVMNVGAESRYVAAEVLRTVAPAIAARALRDAADTIESDDATVRGALQRRADEMEAK